MDDCYVDVQPAVLPSRNFTSSGDKMLGPEDDYSASSNYFLSANQNDLFYSTSDKVKPPDQHDLKAPSDLQTATVCHSLSVSTGNVLESVDVNADMPTQVTGDSFHAGTSQRAMVIQNLPQDPIPPSSQETSTKWTSFNVVSVSVQKPTAYEGDSFVPSNTFLPTNQNSTPASLDSFVTSVPLPTPSCNCLTVTTYTKLPVDLQISTRISAQLIEDSSPNIVKQDAPPGNMFASYDSKTSSVPQLLPLHHCSSVDARSNKSSPMSDTSLQLLSLQTSVNEETLPTCTLVSSCDSNAPLQAPVHSSTAPTQASLRSLQSGIEAPPGQNSVSFDPDSAAYCSSEPRLTPRDHKPSPESASHPNALPSRVTVSASRDVTFGSALTLHGRPLILNQYVDLSNPPLYSAVTVSGPDKPYCYCGWFSFLNIVSALMAITVTILAVLTYYRKIRKCE